SLASLALARSAAWANRSLRVIVSFRGSPASPPGAPHGERYREVVAVGAVVLGVWVVGAGCPTVGVLAPLPASDTGTHANWNWNWPTPIVQTTRGSPMSTTETWMTSCGVRGWGTGISMGGAPGRCRAPHAQGAGHPHGEQPSQQDDATNTAPETVRSNDHRDTSFTS